MSVTVLEVNNLRTYLYTRWGVVKAVDGVSLTVREKESFGLVGESGCGKTTFALSIMRLLPKPSGRIISGQILLEGEDLVGKSEREMRKVRGSRMSMVLQDPMMSLDPVFSVGDQLVEPLMMHGGYRGREIWTRVIELLRLVRIPAPEARLKNYPHELSGGMKQRVLGAVALAREPHLLVADEPTTALDVTTQANYLRLLKELQERMGLTLIYITHDFGIVAQMCHRVGIMYAGKLVEIGEVRQIFNNPLHPYTRALLKSVPRVEERVDRLASIKGQPPALHHLPQGCVFAPRCDLSGDHKCNPSEYPPAAQVEDGHSVSCWLHS